MAEPAVQVPVSLIEQAANLLAYGGTRDLDLAGSFRALLSQPTPIAEPCLSMQGLLSEPCETFTQQSGLTCADDSGRVLGSRYGATEYCWPCRLRAVYSQQPSAEQCCDRPGDPNWHTLDGGHVVPPDIEEDTPVSPPSIADMVPGTKFDQVFHWTVAADVQGGLFAHRPNDALPLAAIDPSTIRDVTPPAAP